jgi:hypothetical protein
MFSPDETPGLGRKRAALDLRCDLELFRTGTFQPRDSRAHELVARAIRFAKKLGLADPEWVLWFDPMVALQAE